MILQKPSVLILQVVLFLINDKKMNLDINLKFSDLPDNTDGMSLDQKVSKLIESQFDKSNSLLVSILELVTISTKEKSIGRNFCYAKANASDIQNVILADYEQMIKEIKESTLSGPSKFFRWYLKKNYPYTSVKNESIPDFKFYGTIPSFISQDIQKPIGNEYIYMILASFGMTIPCVVSWKTTYRHLVPRIGLKLYQMLLSSLNPYRLLIQKVKM